MRGCFILSFSFCGMHSPSKHVYVPFGAAALKEVMTYDTVIYGELHHCLILSFHLLRLAVAKCKNCIYANSFKGLVHMNLTCSLCIFFATFNPDLSENLQPSSQAHTVTAYSPPRPSSSQSLPMAAAPSLLNYPTVLLAKHLGNTKAENMQIEASQSKNLYKIAHPTLTVSLYLFFSKTYFPLRPRNSTN